MAWPAGRVNDASRASGSPALANLITGQTSILIVLRGMHLMQGQEGGRPVALSRFDIPGAQELMVHSCEDCACPVTESEVSYRPFAADTETDSSHWIRAREIVEIPVDGEHKALFNPL